MKKGYSKPWKYRFVRFVHIDLNTGCWIWTGSQTSTGYGQFACGFAQKPIKAHRASWMIYNSVVPDGLNVLHKCDNPLCVNPVHLFLGTMKDNTIDCINKCRKTDPPHFYGESNPSHKLTTNQVIAILHDNRRNAAIAREYNVTWQCIDLIKKRINWKHVHP